MKNSFWISDVQFSRFRVLSSGVQRWIDGVVQQEDVPTDATDVAALGAAQLHAESPQDIRGTKLGVALAQGLRDGRDGGKRRKEERNERTIHFFKSVLQTQTKHARCWELETA